MARHMSGRRSDDRDVVGRPDDSRRRRRVERVSREVDEELELARWHARRRRFFWVVAALLLASVVVYWVL